MDDNSTGYSQLEEVTSPKELQCSIHYFVTELGLTHYAFIDLDKPYQKDNLLNTFPESINKLNRLKFFEYHDAFLQNARTTEKPFFLLPIYEQILRLNFQCTMTQTTMKICELYSSNGFSNLLFVPVRNSYCFIVGAKQANPLQFQRRLRNKLSVLVLLANSIMKKYDSFFPAEKIDLPRKLKAFDVLEKLANSDVNISQLADKIFCSRITVHHHLGNARKVLDCDTNIGAIRKALLSGLIHLDKY